MNFTQSFKLALKSLKTSKMRAFLTMLGIIIGVGAVIVILSLGNGMTNMMNSQFEKMGSNLIQVMTYGRGTGGTRDVDVEDLYELVDKYPQYLTGVTPYVSASAKVRYQTDDYARTSVYGVSEAFFKEDTKGTMQGETLAEGRFLSYIDVDRHQNVCVIGDYLAQTAFRGDALGKTISLSGVPYTVIGVLSKSGDSSEGSADDVIYIPYENAQRMGTGTMMMGTDEMFLLTSTSRDTASAAKGIVEKRLYKTYQSSDYYMVMTSAEMMDAMNTMMNTMMIVLVAIAAISLLVGGIGIMNIMLVSVTERTREIGIRKSLGAKQKDIRGQFVIEAGTTSAVGGVLGIVFGLLLARAATIAVGAIMSSSMNGITFSAVPTLSDIAVSFGVSVGIGVLFGYLPANKAAKLNPIDALRRGIRSAGLTSALFCIFISVMVCLFAAPLMGIFIDPSQADIIAAGVHYLHIEGACYIGIGLLFLLYGYYRAVNQPGMSVVLTIASLGTRVALAYLLSATPLGVTGIWLSVPIGWALADVIGIGYYLVKHRKVTQ